jgi:hypothetical protein
MTTFAEIPLYQWIETRAGRVKPIRSLVEDMYLLYDEKGRYIGAIHADCLSQLLEKIPYASGT